MYDKVFFYFILDYVSIVLVSLRGGTGRGCHTRKRNKAKQI